jgi:hypothetical protein
VHKTPPGTAAGKSIIGGDVKMEYDEDETTGGPRVVRGPGAKKKHTATFESAASTKTTTSKTRKSSGGRIVKSLDFSGQRTSIQFEEWPFTVLYGFFSNSALLKRQILANYHCFCVSE